MIADDRTALRRGAERVTAWAPDAIIGRIEARGIGILTATPAPPTPLSLVIDLDRSEPERLPPARETELLGLTLPLLYGAGHPALADAVLQFLKHPERITG